MGSQSFGKVSPPLSSPFLQVMPQILLMAQFWIFRRKEWSSEACRFPRRKMGYTLNYAFHVFIHAFFFIDLVRVCARVWDTEMTLFNVLEREEIQIHKELPNTWERDHKEAAGTIKSVMRAPGELNWKRGHLPRSCKIDHLFFFH